MDSPSHTSISFEAGTGISTARPSLLGQILSWVEALGTGHRLWCCGYMTTACITTTARCSQRRTCRVWQTEHFVPLLVSALMIHSDRLSSHTHEPFTKMCSMPRMPNFSQHDDLLYREQHGTKRTESGVAPLQLKDHTHMNLGSTFSFYWVYGIFHCSSIRDMESPFYSSYRVSCSCNWNGRVIHKSLLYTTYSIDSYVSNFETNILCC